MENATMRVPVIAILLPVLLGVAGCDDVNSDLSSCIGQAEPSILLRKLTLSESARRAMEDCLKTGYGDDACNALYLNEEVPVRECMSKKGYAVTVGNTGGHDCGYASFRNASCYTPTWRVEINWLFSR